ncbi:MAG: hypothetical protein AB4057_13955 [Crocosphaera sp.]
MIIIGKRAEKFHDFLERCGLLENKFSVGFLITLEVLDTWSRLKGLPLMYIDNLWDDLSEQWEIMNKEKNSDVK